MKKILVGFLMLAIGSLVSTVSFASDGPPTTKVCEILDDFDHSDSFIFTADAGEYNVLYVEYDKSGTAAVIDVGKYTDFDKTFDLDHFGLHSTFTWEANGSNAWPKWNEWLDYKYELSDSYYTEPVLSQHNRNRQIC